MQLQKGRLASGSLSKSPTLPHPLFSALLVSPLPGNTNSGKAGRRKASLSSFIAAAAAAVNESRLEWSESALTARVSADGCMLAFPPQTDVRSEITGWLLQLREMHYVHGLVCKRGA